jgi:hypothetical protein
MKNKKIKNGKEGRRGEGRERGGEKREGEGKAKGRDENWEEVCFMVLGGMDAPENRGFGSVRLL